jgi:uncharacterized membrane protein YesL
MFINYNKPGPGVSKNAPPQKPVPRFFSILQRKFFDLIKLNLLFCIPVVTAGLLVVLLNRITPIVPIDFLPLIFLFPFIGGLTFVTRNYAREEHAFIFSDFKDAVRNNWAAFLADGAVCYAVFLVLSVSIPYYWRNGAGNLLSVAATAICVVIALLFLFSQYYVPVMIVTFDLKFGQILKNSFIFAILGLWRNFLITFLLGILVVLLYVSQIMPLTILLAVTFAVFLLFSYCSFLINFAVYPLVDKMMIKPYEEKHRKNGGEEDKSDHGDFIDQK